MRECENAGFRKQKRIPDQDTIFMGDFRNPLTEVNGNGYFIDKLKDGEIYSLLSALADGNKCSFEAVLAKFSKCDLG
jgi:hypothetical protein